MGYRIGVYIFFAPLFITDAKSCVLITSLNVEPIGERERPIAQ